MDYEPARSATAADAPVAVRRVIADGARWRVLVDAWPAGNGWTGRLIFEPDGSEALQTRRIGPPKLDGRTREAVVAAAHEIDDRRLREMLHSLV